MNKVNELNKLIPPKKDLETSINMPTEKKVNDNLENNDVLNKNKVRQLQNDHILFVRNYFNEESCFNQEKIEPVNSSSVPKRSTIVGYKTKGFQKFKHSKHREIEKRRIPICEKLNNVNMGKMIYTHNNKFLMNTEISGKTITWEIDSGAGLSVLSHNTLMKVKQDYQKTFKKYKTNIELTGVSGTALCIKGLYKIPMKIPIIGDIMHKVYIVDEADVNLLGRDFFYLVKLSIIYENGIYYFQYDDYKAAKLEATNLEEIALGPGKTKRINIKINDIIPGNYEINLLKQKVHENIIMPSSIISIEKTKDNEKNVKVIIGNCSSQMEKYPKNYFRFNLKPLEQDLKYVQGDKVSEADLKIGPLYLEKGPKNVPKNLRNVYDCNATSILLNKFYNDDCQYFKLNKVCPQCCVEKVNGNNINKLHIYHLKNKNVSADNQEAKVEDNVSFEDIEKMLSNEKVSSNSDIEGLEIEDKYLKSLDLNDEILNGELTSIPVISKEEIEDEIDKICEKYDDNIVKLLRPILNKCSKDLLKSNWDLPTCKKPLHFELSKPIPKNTKVYPIKDEYKANFFSTLQYLVYYNIIERCPADSNYGVPTFAIPRANIPGESSRPIRILLDLRQNNKCIAGSQSASFSSCWDLLRSIAANTKYLTVIDLVNMFYSCEVSEEVVASGFANFSTPWGCFRLLRGATGCSFLPSFINQQLVEELYKDGEGNLSFIHNLATFFDDITLGSKIGESLEDHFNKVDTLMERITRCGFRINLLKSKFAVDLEKDAVTVLGFRVSHNKIEITKDKKKDILDTLRTPKTVKNLQKLVGSINYLRSILSVKALKAFAYLPTFMKKSKLVWNEDGDKCLQIIKNCIENDPLHILLPPDNSINVLYTDSSEISLGAILYFVPLKHFETGIDESIQYHESDNDLNNHIHKYNLDLKAISRIIGNVFDFCVYVYSSYKYSMTQSKNQIKTLFINELSLLKPILEEKYPKEGKNDILKVLIDNLNAKEESCEILAHVLFYCLSRILQRQIHIIMGNKNYLMSKPFFNIGENTPLSPIFISSSVSGYQLHALITDYHHVPKFSRCTIDQLKPNQIVDKFKKFYKEGKFSFGGCFSRRIPLSHESSPIYVKELLALTVGLSYFDEYVKIQSTICILDNSIVHQTLKTYKSRELNKFQRISLTIQAQYPSIQFCLVPSSCMKADMLTRLDYDKFDEKNLVENLQFESVSEYFDNFEKKSQQINYVSPLCQEYGIGKLITPEKIIDINIKNHSEKLTDSKYKNVNGIIYLNEKMVLPPELYGSCILKYHVLLGHLGKHKLVENIKDIYTIENLMNFGVILDNLIGSCMLCLASKTSYHKPFLWQSKYGTRVGFSVSIDCIEFSKSVTRGNFYITGILLCLDNVSKYHSVYFLQNLTTSAVINAMLSYFSEHCIPKVILSDNASIFSAPAFKNLLRLFDIKQIVSSPFHSQSRGKVERAVRIYREFSRRFSNLYPNMRIELSYVFCCKIVNHSKITNVPASPHFLANYNTNNNVMLNDYRQNILDDFSRDLILSEPRNKEQIRLDATVAYTTAMKLLEEIRIKTLAKNNKNKVHHKFKPFDVILVKDFARKTKHTDTYIYDPHIIIEIRGMVSICESLISGVVRTRHISHIKKIQSINDLEIPKDILLKNQIYSKELLELLQNKFNKNKNAIDKRITRSSKDKSNKNELDGNLSSDEDHVHFEI